MKTNEKFSYFQKGVTCTTPTMDTTLEAVYNLIKSDKLKEITQQIREGKVSKLNLPSVCFSGSFISRRLAALKEYSSLICMDIDDLDFTLSLKERISADAFLNPVLLYISPRGRGLKIIVRIADGSKENHADYFRCIAAYLISVYRIEADSSGSDIPRLSFLCYDENVCYNPEGFVTSEALLRLLPTPVDASIKSISTASTSYPVLNCSSAGIDEKPSDKLNRLPQIHDLAVEALIRTGWHEEKNGLWRRPGKAFKDGHSAKYNIYPESNGIWLFYCFSSNAQPFENKGYTDVQIICLLNYENNWAECIADLATRYLDPV